MLQVWQQLRSELEKAQAGKAAEAQREAHRQQATTHLHAGQQKGEQWDAAIAAFEAGLAIPHADDAANAVWQQLGTELAKAKAGKAAEVQRDHPVLASWSAAEIEATVNSLRSTPAELLTESPIGPFLVLSSIAIWRDGLAAWNIPPCSTYMDICPPGFTPFA